MARKPRSRSSGSRHRPQPPPGGGESRAASELEPKPVRRDAVLIRAATPIATILLGAALDEAAMRWNYVLRNRRRWLD